VFKVTIIAPPLGLTEKKAGVSRGDSTKVYFNPSSTVVAANSSACTWVIPSSCNVC
jgi:hypothetical protein